MMTRPSPQIPFFVALLGAYTAMAHPAFAQKVALRWKYEQGSELVYRMTNHQEARMSAMAGTSVTEQIQTMRWTVDQVAPNGDATVTVSTERVQLDRQGVEGNLRYDSQTDSLPTDPLASVFAAMAGQSYTVVIDPAGTVRSVQGLEALRDKLIEALPPEAAAMMQGMTEQLFSEESMTRMMQQAVQLFPQEPVGPGDTWQHAFSLDLPMIGTTTTNTEYTVTGFEQRDGRTVALIASTGEMAFGSEGAQLPVTMDLGSTEMSGSIEFDVDRGVALSSTMSMVMQMTVGARGQSMAMTMNQTTNVELIEYVPGR